MIDETLLLFGHLADGGVAPLLDDPQATDHKRLQSMNIRLEEDGGLQTIQQGWEDHTIEDAKLGYDA